MPAPRKTPVATPKIDLNSLLEHDAPEDAKPQAPSVDDDPTTEQETEEHENSVPTVEQIELEALRAELAAYKAKEADVAKSAHVERPKPESELTPEERQIRALQDELARVKGKNIDKLEEIFETGDEVILIHVLKDGFTAQGRVWYRGQEISFGPEAYKDTQDRLGQSWLSEDEEEQFEKRGDIYFRRGPWPGKRTYDESGLSKVSITNKAPVVSV